MSAENKTANHRLALTRQAVLGTPRRHPLRGLPVVALMVAGAAHIPVIPAHLREAPYIGILFIVLAVASFVLATVLVFRDVQAAYVVTVVLMALAVLAYVISRTVGLPQIGDDVGHWFEPLGVVAVISESAACVGAMIIGLKSRGRFGAHAGTSKGV